jgi:hypothetical protein
VTADLDPEEFRRLCHAVVDWDRLRAEVASVRQSRP